jgi:hypothetical protein
MFTSFISRRSTRSSRARTTIWSLLVGAIMAALLGGPIATATAVTIPADAPVRVVRDGTGKTPLLTATRLAGTEVRFAMKSAPLHIDALPGIDHQYASVSWTLQTAAVGTNLQWRTVQSVDKTVSLHHVVEDFDAEGGSIYSYPSIVGGYDVPGVSFTSQLVTAQEVAYRVVAKVTWLNQTSTLRSVTLNPTVSSDLACAGPTSARCRVIGLSGVTTGSWIDLMA